MKSSRVMIDTVPLPEKPIHIDIPIDVLKEFKRDARVVVRHPWVVGIPVPLVLIERIRKNPAAYRALTRKFDLMLVAK